MTTKTHHAGSDEVTSRGTVKGHHPKPGDDVLEGGPAPAPTEGHGKPKGSAAKAQAEGAVQGEDTSAAVQGKADKEHAAEAGAAKTQSGRGHRKHEA